ncbi:MAG: DUF4907 domain-containing protein [Deltaproteobacteria bacterium]|nr:DUF4907 domain-containing protein [Deltaproteobacteria bacterium]
MSKYKFLISVFLSASIILAYLPGTSISAGENTGKQEVKQASGKQATEQKNPYARAQISIKIISSIHKTFGYDILIQGKPFIHQPNIPALPGNEGFATGKRARKVAEFVVRKIRKNEMPPAVTVEDLNKMGVLNQR